MALSARGRPTPDQDDQPVELIDGLMSISRVLVALAARTLAAIDAEVTLPQYRVLVVLASRGPQRTIDLAGELTVVSSTVTRTCDRLVRKGLVRRYQRGTDRRAVWIALTDNGKKLVGEVMRSRREALARLAAGADIDDPPEVARALRALTVAAGEVPDPQWWQLWESSTATDASMWPIDPPSDLLTAERS